jgi:signal transduction histidine kinase
MTEVHPSAPVSLATPAPAYIGPLLREDAVLLRYGTAVAVVLLIAGIRALLAPLLGTQAPLLPFVLGIFAAAYLGGRGPAMLASVLTPILATLWFTNWPQDAPPTQWIAHVVFFLLIAMLSSQLMHELQKRSRTEREALAIAASHAQALREADRRKDEFLAMLAHELRNPLAPIRNAGEILSRNLPADVPMRTAVHTIERQVTHLTRLVDDLLDVSRITRGRIELRRRPIPVADITGYRSRPRAGICTSMSIPNGWCSASPTC